MDGVHAFFISRIPNLVSHDFALLPVRRAAISTAGGRAIMSRLPQDDVDRIIEHSVIHKLTSKTITDLEEIRRLIAIAKRDGVSCQDGEILEMECAVAAPVLGDGDLPVAAVTVSIDRSRYTMDEARAHFTDMVKLAAQRMSSPSLSASRLPPTITR